MPRAPSKWLVWVQNILGGGSNPTIAKDDHPAHGGTPSIELADDGDIAEEQRDAPAHGGTPSIELADDGGIAEAQGDAPAHGGTPSIELAADGGIAEEQGDAPTYNNTRHRSSSIPSADDDGVREEQEGNRPQDGSLSIDPVNDGGIAEEEAYPPTRSTSTIRDYEGSPRYFRTPSMELPGDLQYPSHDETPSFRVPRSPASLRSASVEEPDHRDQPADDGDAEELDIFHETSGSHEEEELRARAVELLGEIQDKTDEYLELSNLAERSSRCLPHLMEEAASPKEVSEAAACSAGHLTAARLAQSAAWLAEWEHKQTLARLEQLRASRKRSAAGDEAPSPKVARQAGPSGTRRSSASLVSTTRRKVRQQ